MISPVSTPSNQMSGLDPQDEAIMGGRISRGAKEWPLAKKITVLILGTSLFCFSFIGLGLGTFIFSNAVGQALDDSSDESQRTHRINIGKGALIVIPLEFVFLFGTFLLICLCDKKAKATPREIPSQNGPAHKFLEA